MKVYATNVIYSRIIGLQASGREYLKNELAPVPMAMFDNSGDMRVAKIMSTFKRELQVKTLNQHMDQDNSLIVNGSVMLWKEIRDYVDKAVTWTRRNFQESGVYLVFNRYMEYNIKDNTRKHQTEGSKPAASHYVDHAVNHKSYC